MAKPLSKTAIDYTRDRIEEIVRCTNGKISTNLQNKRSSKTLSLNEKMTQIRNKKAKLRSLEDLRKNFDLGYSPKSNNYERSMDELFVFAKTPEQKKAMAQNESLDRQIDERHTEVVLSGKRLLDLMCLGMIEVDALPDELEKLARMSE